MKATTRKAVREAFEKLKKELESVDLAYVLQEDSTSEHLEPHYLCQITGFSTRLAPITFFSKDEDDLVKQVKERLGKMEFDQIEIAYLQANAQIHQENADKYKQLAKDAENRLLVEGATNDVRKPMHEDEEEDGQHQTEE